MTLRRYGVPHLRILTSLDTRRIASALRRPTPSVYFAVMVPAGVLFSALWTLGRVGVPALEAVADAVTLAMLVSGAISFFAYGLLFGGADDGFLRQLGVDARAHFLERCGRLACAAAATALALAVPYAAAGQPAGRPLLIGLASAGATTGAAGLVFAWAAKLATGGDVGALLAAGIRKWDPDLARVAHLIYAPLVPFIGGTLYGGLVAGNEAMASLGAVAGVALGAIGVVAGAAVYESAAPRFLPRAREIAYTPPPQGEGEAFRVGRGLSALLPRRPAAVWVRDATVAGRRFPWAARLTWPVAIAAIAALARWGEAPSTRVWVVMAVGLALLIQGIAVVSLGALERRGAGWLDRAAALRTWERLLGRIAWAWGLSLWLLLPVSLAWWWWSNVSGAWIWPLAGLLSAGFFSAASLLGAWGRQ